MLLEMTQGASNLHWTLSASQVATSYVILSCNVAGSGSSLYLVTVAVALATLPSAITRPVSHIASNRTLLFSCAQLISARTVDRCSLVCSDCEIWRACICSYYKHPSHEGNDVDASESPYLFQTIDHPLVYAALVPVIGGVILASLKETSFTWTALVSASLANQVRMQYTS